MSFLSGSIGDRVPQSAMRSSALRWLHIGPRLGLLALFWCLCAGACRDDVTDVASQALLAPVVVEATVLGPVHTLREAAGVRHYVSVRVDKVHKGPVKDKTLATLHFFGRSRNNRHGRSDACAVQPRAFHQGKKYIVFAEVSENFQRNAGDVASGSDNATLTVHGLPAPRNKTSSRQVRKILCKKCAFAPSLNGFKKHVRVNESGPMKLVCKFAGKPPPKIQWLKDGELLKQASHLSIVTTKKKSSLTIRKAKPSDSGEYECRATNVLGPPASMKTTVKVVAKPTTTTAITPPDDKKPCEDSLAREYCHNGGKCFFIISLSYFMCECQPGYFGDRCQSKDVKHVPENRKENMCDTNILTYVVVILGVILFVTILGNLAYFILRKTRKMQKKKAKVSARRRRLSGEDLENIISKGDTIEMAQLHQENANKSPKLPPLELSSANEQDATEGQSLSHNSAKVSTDILTNLPLVAMEPDSSLDMSLKTLPQPKLGQQATRKRQLGVSELSISESSSASPAPSLQTEPSSAKDGFAPTSSKLVEGNNTEVDATLV